MKLKALSLILFVLFPAIALSQTKESAQTEEPVELLLFSSLHCRPCEVVKKELLPKIKEKYGAKIKIKELDTGQPDNYLRLLELGEEYNWHPAEILAPTIFINGKFLVGSDKIKSYLAIYIDTALSIKGMAPTPAAVLAVAPTAKSFLDLISRFKLIRPLAVITAEIGRAHV